jgi:predicted ATPase
VLQLVTAELLVRQGQPSQMRYRCKHALIQEAAYASLLRRRRQQLHTRIAEVLEARQATSAVTPPEVLARHYTAADLPTRAVPYWLQAGERCMQRSASPEAIAHLTRGLEELYRLPDTPARAHQELRLQTALGPALLITRGVAAPEVTQTYTRLRTLAQDLGETPRELWLFHYMRGGMETARALATQLMALAQERREATLLFEAHLMLGVTLFRLDEVQPAYAHLAQASARYEPAQHHAQAALYGTDPGVILHCYAARALWLLGHASQSLLQAEQALALAQQLSHPFSRAYALIWTAFLHQLRREPDTVQALATEAITLASAQDFPFLAEAGAFLQGWVQTTRGAWEAGVAQMAQALAGPRAAGVDQGLPYWLALLAEAYGATGQVTAGLALLEEARTVAQQAGGRHWEAELHRLTGVLLLHQEAPEETRAATWLSQALSLARRQHLTAWELRAALSLANLWQGQGQGARGRDILHEMLHSCAASAGPADYQEAVACLEALRSNAPLTHAGSPAGTLGP